MGVGLTSLEAVADALYAGRPDDFIAERKAAVAAARQAGDVGLAKAIGGLRRPTLGAWYVNLAAHASLVSLREWLALGADLREAVATGDTDTLRTLSARRTPLENRIIADLTAHLRTLGASASPAALEETRTTLRAALSDAASAEAVASGHLSTALTYAGFGEVAFPPAAPAPAPGPSAEPDLPMSVPAEPEPDEAALARERERTRLDEQVTRAEQEVAGLAADATQADRSVADLEARLAMLTDRIRTAQQALEAERRRATAASARVAQARKRLEEARNDRDAL